MSNPRVEVTVDANVKPYTSAMDKAALSTSKVDKASAGMAVGLAKSAGAAAAGAVSLAALSSQIKSTIGAATALQDSQAKVGVIFGESARAISDFAADSSKSFGLTKTAALDAASTFAIFGKAAGLTGGELTKFSTDLTQRAVDLSSFFGKPVEDAITAIGAALRGEAEPARAFGILLDDLTLRNTALEMGLISSVKEGLTPQIRALAAAKEVMRQSGDAAGDYMRTLDGAANSAKQMNAELGRAKETIGTELLPAYAQLTAAGADLISTMGKIGIFENLTGLGVIGSLAAILTDTDSAAVGAATSTDALGAAASGAVGGVDALAASAGAAGGAIGSMDEQLAAAVGGLSAFIDSQQALAGSQRDLLGLENELRESARQTSTTRSTGAQKSSDAERKAQKKVTDGIRARSAAEQEAEIKAARRRAQAKAEAAADKGARRDVRGGVADAIATDKAARAGQDIDGFNQNGSVGEATGSLSKGAQKKLEAQIDGIRARHKKALDAQLKGLKEATTTARSTSSAVDSYSFSLDQNTEAGRRNAETLSGTIDKAQVAAEGAAAAVKLAGGSAAEQATAYRDTLLQWYGAIGDSAEAAGFARTEVDKYLESLGLIPKEISTKIRVTADLSGLNKQLKDGADKARAMYDGIGRSLAARASAPFGVTSPSNPYENIGSAGSRVLRRAGGGEIYGAGTPTSDSVPVWASRGEFVVNAQQYNANRDLVKAINAGTGAVTAGGGINIGAVNVTESSPSRVRASVIDALAEAAYRNGAVR